MILQLNISRDTKFKVLHNNKLFLSTEIKTKRPTALFITSNYFVLVSNTRESQNVKGTCFFLPPDQGEGSDSFVVNHNLTVSIHWKHCFIINELELCEEIK